ncbi:MAG: transketolase [Chloroflexaceae bacterium]|nr:transketolase [Chloroflexaceae bacterium]
MGSDLDRLCANAIRALSMDGVQQANSGHPGLPLGMADAAYVLWTRFLKHNPADPHWPDRDRFVLSAGHGSMLIYSLLHLTGYDLPLEELRRFRQWGSRTAGHPEYHHTPGVETTTGPLGQGVANAVGMALAARYLAEKFNRPGFPVVDHTTYAICSDGDLQEGISHEACSLAGHLKIGKLVLIYDANHVQLDGPTSLAFSENIPLRFQSYGWHVLECDGHDMADVSRALAAAQAEHERPVIIVCRTIIGYGSPNKAGTAKAHGEPLGADEVRLTKEALGWPTEPTFYVPGEVYEHMQQARDTGAKAQAAWNAMFARYREAHPELATLWTQMMDKQLPDWATALPTFPADAKGNGTRVYSGQLINALAPLVPGLLGGSADLGGSNNTSVKGAEPLKPDDFSGRNIYFGVREHAMGAVMNGMALHGGLIPYGGTFLVFSDYMRPTIRLAALMGIQTIYVFTHDSIGLGEDGPTHQPVEHVAALRAMPNLFVVRPGDANEVAQAWRVALERQDGPTALVLSRQAAPVLDRNIFAPAEGALRGAYVLKDAANPSVALLASGSEVQLALAAAELLAGRSIAARVVSMPCWELFAAQDKAYQDEVLPPTLTARVAVEAASPFGWERYVGTAGAVVGVDRFGASAPFKEIYQHYGLTAERVAEVAAGLVGR